MTKTFDDVKVDVELKIMEYDKTRTQLADTIREHDLLDLQTRLNVESVKKYYEEEGLKSTQAKYKAEQEEEVNLQRLIDMEHQIATWKAKRDKLEYTFQYLFREYDRLQFEVEDD